MHESDYTRKLLKQLNRVTSPPAVFRKTHGTVHNIDAPDIIGHINGIHTEIEIKIKRKTNDAAKLQVAQYKTLHTAFLHGALVGLAVYDCELNIWQFKMVCPEYTFVTAHIIRSVFRELLLRSHCNFDITWLENIDGLSHFDR